MLLKNEDTSLKLEFVNYEFPEAGAGSDQFDRNWLLLRCTWVDEEGYTHKDSNACLLAQELAGMNAGLKVLLAGIKDRYDSDFIEPDFTLSAWAEGENFRVSATFYLPSTMDGDDTAEVDCTLTGPELKAVIEDLDKACARFPERK
ncbi:MAG: hypothetical protein EGQ09_20120 [Clostridiales bacterium]|nr:hypothetical protein [Clostridiales bacterium]